MNGRRFENGNRDSYTDMGYGCFAWFSPDFEVKSLLLKIHILQTLKNAA